MSVCGEAECVGVLLMNIPEQPCSWAGRYWVLGQDWSLDTALCSGNKQLWKQLLLVQESRAGCSFSSYGFLGFFFPSGRKCNVLLRGWGAGSLSSFWPVAPLTPPPTCTCVCLSWPETTCTRQVSEGCGHHTHRAVLGKANKSFNTHLDQLLLHSCVHFHILYWY